MTLCHCRPRGLRTTISMMAMAAGLVVMVGMVMVSVVVMIQMP